jgi:hypothetical protein
MVRFFSFFHHRRALATCVLFDPLPGLWLSQRGPFSVLRNSPRLWFGLLLMPALFGACELMEFLGAL